MGHRQDAGATTVAVGLSATNVAADPPSRPWDTGETPVPQMLAAVLPRACRKRPVRDSAARSFPQDVASEFPAIPSDLPPRGALAGGHGPSSVHPIDPSRDLHRLIIIDGGPRQRPARRRYDRQHIPARHADPSQRPPLPPSRDAQGDLTRFDKIDCVILCFRGYWGRSSCACVAAGTRLCDLGR